MSALPWTLGWRAAVAVGALLWSHRAGEGVQPREAHPPDPAEVGPLPGRWVWPVGVWNGRKPELSDGFAGRRRSKSGETIAHGGVDVMYRRLAGDPWPAGTANGSRSYVMPEHRAALAASDGQVWSAACTPRGWTVVVDHGPRTLHAHGRAPGGAQTDRACRSASGHHRR